jgi:hypothetical protein
MHSPISKTIRSGGIDVAWSHPSEAPALPALGPNSVNWIASCFEPAGDRRDESLLLFDMKVTTQFRTLLP